MGGCGISCAASRLSGVPRGKGPPWSIRLKFVPLPVTSLSAFILFPQDLLLAAAFVSDAQYNRNIPFKTSPEAVR